MSYVAKNIQVKLIHTFFIDFDLRIYISRLLQLKKKIISKVETFDIFIFIALKGFTSFYK